MNYDKDLNIPFELTIKQCANWIGLKFEEGGIPLPRAGCAIKRSIAAIDACLKQTDENEKPLEEFIEHCIDAMQKRECFGCKSTDHTLNKCPTHCITAQSNLVDKSKVVKRSIQRYDNAKAGSKKVHALATDDVASQPTHKSSGDDLCTTFGHLTSDEPTEILDMDDHMICKIALEMKDDYNVSALLILPILTSISSMIIHLYAQTLLSMLLKDLNLAMNVGLTTIPTRNVLIWK